MELAISDSREQKQESWLPRIRPSGMLFPKGNDETTASNVATMPTGNDSSDKDNEDEPDPDVCMGGRLTRVQGL